MDTGALAIITAILTAAVQSGTPLLYATLGELVMERSGILNLGVEGMLMGGAFAAFITVLVTGSPWLAFIAGGLAGMALCCLHGLVCMVFQGSQVVSGLALTIFGVALANFLGSPYLGVSTTGFGPVAVPGLSAIPVIGPVLFNQDPLVYISYFLPFLFGVILMRTRYGLALRAVGENPDAARSAGISPLAMRWSAILWGGFTVGLGGAYLSLSCVHMWTNDLAAGRGWIAVALVIFAFWRPGRAVFGAYLFGGIMALQLRMQALGVDIPSSFLVMLPYLLTLAVLFVSSRLGWGREAPAALGVNLKPES